MHFKPLFTGKLVRLAAPQPDDHVLFAQWSQNDEALRVADNDPARPLSPEQHAAWEQPFLSMSDAFIFRLRTLADDALIGVAGLAGVQWTNQCATFIISIGDSAYWSRGYGTDATRLILNYAFNELNLYRVGSSCISYNERSIRLHEKVGFKREGAARAMIQREGQRSDLIYFGILRDEWLAALANE